MLSSCVLKLRLHGLSQNCSRRVKEVYMATIAGYQLMTHYRIFDKILYNRLELWYKPTREQCGAQKNRGSLEQILAIRLLIDYSRKSKKKLFLLYIDFEKAYDKVPCKKLLEELKYIGCDQLFLTTLSSIYSCTKLILKSAIITATQEVRQGAATSVFLFIILY